jgi:hypothetical protein
LCDADGRKATGGLVKLTVAVPPCRWYIYGLIVDRNAPALARRHDRGRSTKIGAVGQQIAPYIYQEAMFPLGHRIE